MPKMFRVYYIDPKSGKKIYSCSCPAYWAHASESPTNCIPFENRGAAEKFAATETKMVSPSGVTRFVEEYDESRPLAKNQFTGVIVPQDHLRYYGDRCCYIAF